jgi:hypothetical protein
VVRIERSGHHAPPLVGRTVARLPARGIGVLRRASQVSCARFTKQLFSHIGRTALSIPVPAESFGRLDSCAWGFFLALNRGKDSLLGTCGLL